MAKVEMELSELRELENKVVVAEKQAFQKEEKVKELEKKIIEVRADKRIIKQRVFPETARIAEFRFDEMNCQSIVDRVYNNVESAMWEINHSTTRKAYNSRHANPLRYAIENAIIGVRVAVACDTIPAITKENTKEEIEYINFEDVQRDLREEAMKSVAEELGELREKAKRQEAEKAQIREKEREIRNQMIIDHEREVRGMVDECNERLRARDEDIKKLNDLLADKDIRSDAERLSHEINFLKEEHKSAIGKLIEEQIEVVSALKNQLETEKKKTFWDKLFS